MNDKYNWWRCARCGGRFLVTEPMHSCYQRAAAGVAPTDEGDPLETIEWWANAVADRGNDGMVAQMLRDYLALRRRIAGVAIPFARGSWQHAVDDHISAYGKTSQEFATPHEAVQWLLQQTADAAIACGVAVPAPAHYPEHTAFCCGNAYNCRQPEKSCAMRGDVLGREHERGRPAAGVTASLEWIGPATADFDAWVAEHQKNGTAFDALAAWLEATKRASGVTGIPAPGHSWHDYGQQNGRNRSWCSRCKLVVWTGEEPDSPCVSMPAVGVRASVPPIRQSSNQRDEKE